MRLLLVAFFAFLLTACSGYKPAPEFSADIFTNPVLIKVKIDSEDPDIGAYLEDEIAKMAINRLNLTLTKNVSEANGYILVNSYTINTTPINKDENGNVIRYSVNSAIEFAIKDKYGFWSKNIVAGAYVTVKPQSLISALDKEKASKLAIKLALDNFILNVIKRSRKMGKNKADMPQENNVTNNSMNTVTQSTSTTDTTELGTVENTTQDTSSNTDNTTGFGENNPFVNEIPDNTTSDFNTTQAATEDNFGIKIIPTDNNDTPIQDATTYN